MTKRAWRVAGLALGLALLLPVLAILLLHTGPARHYLLEKVQTLLLEQGIRLEASGVTYSLAGATARLDGIRLTSTAAPDLPSFLEAGSATVDIGVTSYARGFLHLQDARFKDLKVRLVIDERGRTNLPIPPNQRSESEGQMPDFLIEHLEASPVYLLYENRAAQLRVELPAARLQIDGRMPFTHRVLFQGQRPGSVTFEGTSAPINMFKVEAEVPGNLSSVTVRQLQVRTEGSQARLTGRVEDWNNPRMDFEIRASLAVEQLARFASLQEPLGGTAVLTARGAGTVADLTVRGDLAGYKLQYGQFRDLSLETAFDWERQRQSVRVHSLKVDSPDVAISGSGLVVLSDEAGSSATLDITRADLAGLSRRLAFPIIVDSGAAGRVAATWPGLQFAAVSGEADIRLLPLTAAVRQDRLPLRGSAKVRLEDRKLKGSLHQVRLPGLVAGGDIQIDSFEDLAGVAKGRLSGQINVDFEDLAAFYPSLLGFLGKSGDLTLNRIKPAGRATLSATLGGTVSNPTASASLAAPSLAVGPVSGVQATAQVTATPARLDLESLALRLDGQSANLKGTVGLAGSESPIALDLAAENLDLRQVVAMLGADYPVSGFASLQAQVTGTIDNPVAQAQLQASALQAYEEPLGELSAQLSFADQVARVGRLVLDKSAGGTGSSGNLELSGSYNLDSQAYEVQAEGDRLGFEQLRLPGRSPLAGTLTLRANGSGTVADPRLDFTLNLDKLKFEGFEIPQLRAEGALKNQVAQFRLVSPPYNLQADGQVGIAAPFRAEVRAEVVQMDLAALPPSLLGVDIQGKVTALAKATVDLARPKEADVQATVTDLLVSIDGREIESGGPVELAYSDEVLRIDAAAFTSGASFVTLSGSMPLESSKGPGRVEIRGNLDVGESLTRELGTLYSVDGKLALEGSVTGSFDSLAPTLTATLQNGRFAAPQLSEPVQDINLQVSVRDGQLEVTRLDARLGAGRLQGRGHVPLGIIPGLPPQIQRKDGDAEVTVQGDNFSLGSIAGLPQDLVGTVSLQANLGAGDARLESLSGGVTFNRMDFRIAGIDLRPDRPARILIDGGKAKVEHFVLLGPETRIQAAGTLNLGGQREAELQANGRIDLALLSVLAQDLEASGETEFRLGLSGTASNPQLEGFVAVEGGQLAIQTPSIQVNDLRARLELEGSGFAIREFNGNMNGGSLAASGSAAFVGGVLSPNLKINARGVFLDFPEGLQTVSDADLTIRSAGDLVNVGGLIAIQQGSYTDQLNVEQELLGMVGAADAVAVSERDPLLARVRFNVDVESWEPIVMDNNLAKISADLNMRLVGNYYQPSLLGRLRLDEGGELYLRERTYYIERGVISFNNPIEIEPNLDLSARTQVNDLDVTLRISGVAGDIQTSLTSDPPTPETDLASLLVTGRTLEEARGEAGAVLQEQTLALLSGAFGGRLEASLEDITGLSKVRIEPSLISPESDPTARLTIGQDLTNKLGLIYSMNLADSSDRIYIGEYDVTRRFIGRVVHETDPQDALEEGSKYRFEVRHDLRFGLFGREGEGEQSKPRAEDRRKVTSLRFEGQSPYTDKQLADKCDLEVGDKYDFFKVRRATENLKATLIDDGYLEASVRLSRENVGPESVALTLRVVAGPQVAFRFEGFSPSGDLERTVRASWSKGVFDELRLETSREAVLSALLIDGYMEARIESEITTREDRKEIVFRIQSGPRFEQVTVEFQGASSPLKERLEEQFGGQKLAARAQTSFGELDEQIRTFYSSEGYLHAEVGAPVPRLDPSSRTAAVILPIREGPRAQLAQVEFEGNSVWSDEDLGRRSLLVVGQTFRPSDRDAAALRLRLFYAAAGYNDAVVIPDVQSDAETGKVRLGFTIEENSKEVVRALEVRGNGKTSERFIMNLVALSVGDPFTPEKVALSRRALYDTGAFALAELETEEIQTAADSPGEKPLRVTVRVQEVSPYRLQYGGFYDTERGLGAIADFTNRNTLGNAAVLGLRARYDDTFREGRVYFGQPQLGGLPFDSNAAAFFSREIRPSAGFISDRVGFSVQQEKLFRKQFVLSWGYRFERDRTYDPADLFFDITLDVAPLTANFSRDVRDDILDASRGSFMSHSLEFAPKLLGSDLRFIRYFGQYSHYVPLSEPEEIPLSSGLRKSRLVYAGAVRLGLAHGFDDQRLVPSERFYAGGGTSIRGFEQDEIGPRNIIGDPAGGQSLFVMNHELRFPLYHIVDGVGFFDLGNVYRDVRDLDLFDVRYSAGVGLRIRTPYFLLRGDLGFNLFPREGEKRSAFFFSIGQAF